MAKSQLQKEISALAAVLADAVVKAISARSLSELADITENPVETTRRSAPKRARISKRAARKDAKVPAKKAPSNKPRKAPTTPDEARAGVLAALKESKEWLKAGAILDAVKKPVTADLLRRVLRELMGHGHIAKRGATRNTEYQITASGLAA